MQQLIDFGISPDMARRMVAEFDEPYLLAHLEAVRKRKGLQNPPGYLLCSIRQGWRTQKPTAEPWYKGNEDQIKR